MEEILTLANSITDNIIDFIDDDNILNPLLQISGEVLETSIPAVKILFKISNKIRILKFKAFLEGIAKSCTDNNSDGKRLKEKLVRLTKRPFYNEFINEAFSSAINATSTKTTAILGYYLAQNGFMEKKITLEQMIICKALRELTDLEVVIFKELYLKAVYTDKDVNPLDKGNPKKLGYIDAREKNTYSYDIPSITNVIEELKKLRIVNRGEGSFEYTERSGFCFLTGITEKFYDLIKDFY